MTTLYQYRIWCETENTYTYVWSETVPTVCPKNTTHDISTSTITIVNKMETPMVTIQNDVAGSYQSSTVRINVPASEPGSIYTQDISFPHDTYIWTSEFMSDSSMVGDEFNIIVSPNTTIGVITTPSLTGATTFSVSSTIFTSGYVTRGVDLSISDGTNTQILGRVSDMDTVNQTITVENPLVIDYNPGSYLLLNVYIVRNQYIGAANKTYLYGKKGFSAKKLAKGQVLQFLYKNNTGTTKIVNCDIEYNYI